MARGPTYRVPFRRRREGRTNYHSRLKLLLSGRPRLVVRKSNRNMRAQLIAAGKNGDQLIESAVSSALRKYGYNGYTGNTCAAYLSGMLLGLKATNGGHTDAILDVGLQTSTRGSRVYAVLKGALDAGMNIPHDPDILPDEERIKGQYPDGFDSVKETMMKEFGK